MQYLIKTVILIENEPLSGIPPLSPQDFLHNSIFKIVFEYYTKLHSKWLVTTWQDHLNNLDENYKFILNVNYLENNPEILDNNNHQIKKLCFMFLESAVQSLIKAPKTFWDFLCSLSDHTSQDPFQFLLINFFIVALQKPLEYGLFTRKPSEQESLILDKISIMLTNIANASEYLLPKIRLEPSEREYFTQKIKSWLNDTRDEPLTPNTTINWLSERDALISLTDFIIENQDSILRELKNHSIVIHLVKFGVTELVDSLSPQSMSLPSQKKTSPNLVSRTSSLSPSKEKRQFFRKKTTKKFV